MKFTPQEVSLNSYGNHRLDVIAQILLTLAQGELHTNAIVLIQKQAPNDLLLETDVQFCLGFAIVVERSGTSWTSSVVGIGIVALVGQGGDSGVQKETIHSEASGEDRVSQEYSTPMGVVCLLQPTKIPASYEKMVRARVLLFTPSAMHGEGS